MTKRTRADAAEKTGLLFCELSRRLLRADAVVAARREGDRLVLWACSGIEPPVAEEFLAALEGMEPTFPAGTGGKAWSHSLSRRLFPSCAREGFRKVTGYLVAGERKLFAFYRGKSPSRRWESADELLSELLVWFEGEARKMGMPGVPASAGAGVEGALRMIVTFDKEVLADPRMSRFLGWSGPVSLSEFLENVDPSARPQLGQSIEAILARRVGPRRALFRILCPDGSWRELEAFLSPIRWEGKSAVSVLCREVAGPSELEKRARDAEAFAGTLFETLPVGALMLEELTVTWANRAAASLMAERSPDGLVGTRLEGFFGPREATRVERWLERARHGWVAPLRETVVRADGTRVPVELRATWIPGGERVLLFLVDCSEVEALSRQVEQSARRASALQRIVRAVLDSSTEKEVAASFLQALFGMLPFDAGCVACHVIEEGRSELLAGLGEESALFVPPGWWVDALPQRRPFVAMDLAGESGLPEWLVPAREKGWRSVICFPLLEGGGLFGSLTLFAADPSAFRGEELDLAIQAAEVLALGLRCTRLRRELEEQSRLLEERIGERRREIEEKAAELEQLNAALVNLLDDLRATNLRLERTTQALLRANEDLESFVYTVSHDLRAPLRAIQGYCQAVLEEAAPLLTADAVLYLHRSLEAGRRMEALITDLLEYSRIGTMRVASEPVDLDGVVDELLGLYEEEIRSRKARVRVEKPLGRVLGDEGMLVRVVGNLLANALKFVPPGRRPRVRISSEQSPDTVRISVQDNGIGIPPEHRERVFRVFERLHGVEKYPGTGVGLAIVRRGVERMRGRVGVESGPRGGSRFWIELPRAGPGASRESIPLPGPARAEGQPR